MPKGLKLEFSEEQLCTFDNALDLLFERGYETEVKYQPAKQVGDVLIQYAIMRSNPDLDVQYGDIMVKLELRSGKANITFHGSVDGNLVDIPAKFILGLPKIN